MLPAASITVTKDKLLQAAQELMLSRGFIATSVEDVCQAAGVTKGSFFHYFKGKEHLGQVVAERFFEQKAKVFLAAPFRQKKDPLDRVMGYLDFLIEMTQSSAMAQGCLLGTFVQELSESHPAIRDVCASCFDRQIDVLERDLEEAKALYAPKARWKPRGLAEHLLAVMQGSIILAKAKQNPAVIADNLRYYRDTLKHAMGQ